MARNPSYLSAASERYLVDILSYLYENGDTNITRLTTIVANNMTLSRALDRFEELGLVSMHKEPNNRYILKIYSLTPKGKEIAELAYQFRKRMLELRIGTE